MKKNEMIFYQLLRDYLNDYLVTRRNFSAKTIRAYRQAFVLLRHYCFEVKGIRFDQMDFSCFSRGGCGRNPGHIVKGENPCTQEKIELRQ